MLRDSSGIVILFKGTTDIYQLIRVEDLQIKKNKRASIESKTTDLSKVLVPENPKTSKNPKNLKKKQK